MAEHDKGTASVSRLSIAETGDVVWFFEAQQALHIDGKYAGRGVWKLRHIEGATRASFIINNAKFDRQTGIERPRNGYSSNNRIAGEVERQDIIWRENHRHHLVRHIESLGGADLRRIAEFIGWNPNARDAALRGGA